MDKQGLSNVTNEASNKKGSLKNMLFGKEGNGEDSNKAASGLHSSRDAAIELGAVSTARRNDGDRFLPAIGAAPPMPSFQRHTSQHAFLSRTSPRHITSDDLPTISDPGHLLTPRLAPTIRVGQNADGHLKDSPALPRGWSRTHDSAICHLDVRDFDPKVIAIKMRGAFPELEGPLNADMVEKRLRQLDYDIECDHFTEALRRIDNGTERGEGSPQGASSGARTSSIPNLKENTPTRAPRVPPKSSRRYLQTGPGDQEGDGGD